MALDEKNQLKNVGQISNVYYRESFYLLKYFEKGSMVLFIKIKMLLLLSNAKVAKKIYFL